LRNILEAAWLKFDEGFIFNRFIEHHRDEADIGGKGEEIG
jgi:hypothetical protein